MTFDFDSHLFLSLSKAAPAKNSSQFRETGCLHQNRTTQNCQFDCTNTHSHTHLISRTHVRWMPISKMHSVTNCDLTSSFLLSQFSFISHVPRSHNESSSTWSMFSLACARFSYRRATSLFWADVIVQSSRAGNDERWRWPTQTSHLYEISRFTNFSR